MKQNMMAKMAKFPGKPYIAVSACHSLPRAITYSHIKARYIPSNSPLPSPKYPSRDCRQGTDDSQELVKFYTSDQRKQLLYLQAEVATLLKNLQTLEQRRPHN